MIRPSICYTGAANRAKETLIPRFYYGWYLVGIAYLSLFLSASASTTLSVLIPTMSQDLGWSVSALVGASSIGVAIGAVVGPWFGRLVDLRGPRVMMTLSIFTLGLVCAQTGTVTEPWQLYLGFGVVGGICRTMSMYIGPGALLANWFVRKRAAASGIAALGPPSCSLVIPAVTTFTMAAFGWRGSWFIYGAICMFLFAPPMALLVRHRPEDLGLRPDGAVSPTLAPGSPLTLVVSAPEADWTLRETLRSRGFWLLAISMALIGLLPNTIFVLHFSTFKAQGLSDAVAAGCVAMSGLTQVISRILLWTPLVGRLGVRRGLFAWSGLIFVGGLMWAVSQGEFMAYAVSGFMGLALGGNLLLQLMVWPEYFGRSNIGAIMGTANVVLGFSQAAGPVLSAGIVDITGSYSTLYFILTGVVAAGIVIQLVSRKPVRGARLVAV